MSEPTMTTLEAMRLRPAMYIGSTSIRGFNHILLEIACYAFDKVKANEFTFRIIGDTEGEIAFCNLESPFNDSVATESTENCANRPFDFFELAALNALSRSFTLQLVDEGGSTRKADFTGGSISSGEITDGECLASKVEIKFDLDTSIFDLDSRLNPYFYLSFLQTLAFLNKGKKVKFSFGDGEQFSEVSFKFDDGLFDLLEIKRLGSLFGSYYFPIHFEFQSEEFEAEIALGFWENPINLPFQISFVNHQMSPENGVHLDAVLEGVRSAVNIKQDSSNAEVEPVAERAIRRSLNCAVHVKMPRPHFEGSYRGKLLSPEIVDPITSAVSSRLLTELNNNRVLANELVNYLSRNARLNNR